MIVVQRSSRFPALAFSSSILSKKEYEKKIAQTPFKIKVVEKSGTQLKRVVQVSNPFRSETCNDEECFVCSSGEKKNCRKNEIKYHIECEDDVCKDDRYHGETSRNGYTRGGEHMKAYKRREDGSFMWKHCRNKHGGEDRRFKMKIDRTFRKDPLLRQITEAIEINDTDESHRMNSKAEWHLPKVPRVSVGTM